MQPESADALFESERKHMEAVYSTFEKMCEEAEAVAIGAYSGRGGEDHDVFLLHSKMYTEKEKLWKRQQLTKHLYDHPYFAHLEAEIEDGEESEHFYLSDNENLNELILIGDSGYLIPFRRDKERPIFAALYQCYTAANGEPVEYKSPKGEAVVCAPLLICNDDVCKRELRNVTSIYPETDLLLTNIDELLQKKLEENRKDAELKNIIQTLQRQQFKIINTDTDISFVVQGCAGSGKSQCLLHRLFYLRGELSDNKWDRVLVLTPTQLFRNYSADLMRRFQLSDIHDCSVAELYRELLCDYDSRFKDRQYEFELSEEYLPDEYLQIVYNPETMKEIETEITSAIVGYVQDACNALQVPVPEQITQEVLEGLQQQLNTQIETAHFIEARLREDAEYMQKHEELEQIQKDLQAEQKNQDRIMSELQKQAEKKAALREAAENLKKSEEIREEWVAESEGRKQAAYRELDQLAEQLDDSADLHLMAAYARQLAVVRRMKSPQLQEEEAACLQVLDQACKQAEQELRSIAKGQTPERLLRQYAEKQAVYTEQADMSAEKIKKLSAEMAECAAWLQRRESDLVGREDHLLERKSVLTRAQYYLGRLESAVFEREVWNALAPIKAEYGIRTMQTEQSDDGNRHERRILYKSDLLFYLEIYVRLHPNTKLPDYTLLCIDEGQDLHKADYDMLHSLFPDAAFNVFGDTAQVLHRSCGVTDWQQDTGIQNIQILTRNYRNTAAVVEFCNEYFGTDMRAVGSVQEAQRPILLSDIRGLQEAVGTASVTVILKNRQIFETFCDAVGKDETEMEFLDTRTEKPSGKKIPCYSVFAAKGLEFRTVLVYAEEMTGNQKVVACTRAMETLYYYE